MSVSEEVKAWEGLWKTNKDFVRKSDRAKVTLKTEKVGKILVDDEAFLLAWKEVMDSHEAITDESEKAMDKPATRLALKMWDIAFDASTIAGKKNILSMNRVFIDIRDEPIDWSKAPDAARALFFTKSNRLSNKCNGLNRRAKAHYKDAWTNFPVPSDPSDKFVAKRAKADDIMRILGKAHFKAK